jgi:hypothetical protein
MGDIQPTMRTRTKHQMAEEIYSLPKGFETMALPASVNNLTTLNG